MTCPTSKQLADWRELAAYGEWVGQNTDEAEDAIVVLIDEVEHLRAEIARVHEVCHGYASLRHEAHVRVAAMRDVREQELVRLTRRNEALAEALRDMVLRCRFDCALEGDGAYCGACGFARAALARLDEEGGGQ